MVYLSCQWMLKCQQLTFMSMTFFMLCWVEHEKCFITSSPGGPTPRIRVCAIYRTLLGGYENLIRSDLFIYPIYSRRSEPALPRTLTEPTPLAYTWMDTCIHCFGRGIRLVCASVLAIITSIISWIIFPYRRTNHKLTYLSHGLERISYMYHAS